MSYRNLLDKIRLTFPQPVSDAIHNSYFVHSIMRALDQVDELKTDYHTNLRITVLAVIL